MSGGQFALSQSRGLAQRLDSGTGTGVHAHKSHPDDRAVFAEEGNHVCDRGKRRKVHRFHRGLAPAQRLDQFKGDACAR